MTADKSFNPGRSDGMQGYISIFCYLMSNYVGNFRESCIKLRGKGIFFCTWVKLIFYICLCAFGLQYLLGLEFLCFSLDNLFIGESEELKSPHYGGWGSICDWNCYSIPFSQILLPLCSWHKVKHWNVTLMVFPWWVCSLLPCFFWLTSVWGLFKMARSLCFRY